jgi:acyl-coenzyme A synthetase/AMP-(fatty) acid ligase
VTTFNLTTWFVDRHLEEGRGDRTALICGDQRVTYAELAALVNRTGHVLRDLGVRQEERVLLALSDGVEFVATWYAAQKIGAVTTEIYTFLPPKDVAYYLDRARRHRDLEVHDRLDRHAEGVCASRRHPAAQLRALRTRRTRHR